MPGHPTALGAVLRILTWPKDTEVAAQVEAAER
jgi:hypothetical protein